MKYDTQFHTQLDTARSELEFLKAANIDTDLKLKDLKKMTTQEFYQKFEKLGKNKKESSFELSF